MTNQMLTYRWSYDQIQKAIRLPGVSPNASITHRVKTLYREQLPDYMGPSVACLEAFLRENGSIITASTRENARIHFMEQALRALEATHSPTPQETTPMSKPNQLFRVIGSNPEVYVTLLATDSSNKSVVEEKGTGKIFSIEPNKLEKVLPYTVGVKFMTGATVYNYLTSANKVKKNDVLVCTRNGTLSFAVVTEVNTKSEQATATLEDSFDSVLSTKDLK